MTQETPELYKLMVKPLSGVFVVGYYYPTVGGYGADYCWKPLQDFGTHTDALAYVSSCNEKRAKAKLEAQVKS